VAIDGIDIPDSDGWWLKQLYQQLLEQRAYCQRMLDRYFGDPPLPFISEIQRDSVRYFVGQSRTNFERLIVDSVLSRLRIRGIRTAVDADEGGDPEAFHTWKTSRGKLWAHDVHRLALAASRAYVIVGKDENGDLLVTAEDPRMVTAITDPENPYKVKAGLKVFYDYTEGVEKAFLYRPGRAPRIAQSEINTASPVVMAARFTDRKFDWLDASFAPALDEDDFTLTVDAPWLAAHDGLPELCPIVPFINQDGLSEFEPFIPLLDRINQQILQRMTIATIQAFKQRAFKGLPQKDPKTGEDINYDEIFVADPGAIWNIPAAAEIWESGQVDLQPILLAVRDDIKDLAAVSGTPLYTISPDVANGSAEGASLQREQLNFRVEARQDRWEIAHEMVVELIFRTLGDDARARPGTVEVMWAHTDRPSLAERASAIAQTTGVIPRYQQLTEIWGMDPDQANRAMTELKQDFILDAQFSAAAAPTAPAPPAPAGTGRGVSASVAQAQRVGSEAQRAQIVAQRRATPTPRTTQSPAPAGRAAGG
jgi:Phage portal protein, SPP1 Gp6-like